MTIDVAVVGAGPTGLMLACELALADAEPVVIERLAEPSVVPKANGLVGQVVELMDRRGLLERLGAESPPTPMPGFSFGAVGLDLTRLDDNPLYGLVVPQPVLEQALIERARELGVDVRRGQEVTGVTQDASGVTIDLGGGRLRARYVVGCDGAHSVVRKRSGIGFPGTTSSEVTRMGEVDLPSAMLSDSGELRVPGMDSIPPAVWTRTERGAFVFGRFTPETYRVAVVEDHGESADRDDSMPLDELHAAVRRVLGADVPLSRPRWLSRTVGHSRQAERYQQGRVLLAGDAAHLFAAGGAALNTGLMDAANLGWKLAAELRGTAPVGLLDSYHKERHAAGARALLHTRAQAALMGAGVDAEALRQVFGELLQYDQPLRHIGELLNGSDFRYDLPGDHPMTGRWMPDLPLATSAGLVRVAQLMRVGRPLLIELATRTAVSATAQGWVDRVDVVSARAESEVADALLIRPDGYVAWAVDRTYGDDQAADELSRALTMWFGPPKK